MYANGLYTIQFIYSINIGRISTLLSIIHIPTIIRPEMIKNLTGNTVLWYGTL
jgi:hypothetical protein